MQSTVTEQGEKADRQHGLHLYKHPNHNSLGWDNGCLLHKVVLGSRTTAVPRCTAVLPRRLRWSALGKGGDNNPRATAKRGVPPPHPPRVRGLALRLPWRGAACALASLPCPPCPALALPSIALGVVGRRGWRALLACAGQDGGDARCTVSIRQHNRRGGVAG